MSRQDRNSRKDRFGKDYYEELSEDMGYEALRKLKPEKKDRRKHKIKKMK